MTGGSPAAGERRPLQPVRRHAILSHIGTAAARQSSRANWWAAATLVATLVGVSFVASSVWRAQNVPHSHYILGEWPDLLLTIVPFGLAGAVLLDRRPDLPFGWLLAVGAASQALFAMICLPSGIALLKGNTSAAVRWGHAADGLLFVPLCIQGVINIRFPSGRPASRRGRALEIVIVAGTVLVVGGALFGATGLRGDSATVPAPLAHLEHPLTGGTLAGRIADDLALVAPIVAILTLVAGIGVVVRFFRAAGIERQQLKWRSAHVIIGFLLLPL